MGVWLARLQSETTSSDDPTKPTNPTSVGFVGNQSESTTDLDQCYESMSRAQATDADLLPELIAAAMLCCDFWGDGSSARTEMVADIHRTPEYQRGDLLAHLQSVYGKAKG
jgi:hypothetical protein